LNKILFLFSFSTLLFSIFLLFVNPSLVLSSYTIYYKKLINLKLFEDVYGQESNSKNSSFKKFKNKDYGFSIEYPNNWIKIKKKDIYYHDKIVKKIVDLRPNKNKDLVSVSIWILTISDNQNPNQVVSPEEKKEYTDRNYVLLQNDTNSYLLDRPANTLTYSITKENQGTKNIIQNTWTVIGNNVLSIVYHSSSELYNDYLPKVEDIKNTLIVSDRMIEELESGNTNSDSKLKYLPYALNAACSIAWWLIVKFPLGPCTGFTIYNFLSASAENIEQNDSGDNFGYGTGELNPASIEKKFYKKGYNMEDELDESITQIEKIKTVSSNIDSFYYYQQFQNGLLVQPPSSQNVYALFGPLYEILMSFNEQFEIIGFPHSNACDEDYCGIEFDNGYIYKDDNSFVTVITDNTGYLEKIYPNDLNFDNSNFCTLKNHQLKNSKLNAKDAIEEKYFQYIDMLSEPLSSIKKTKKVNGYYQEFNDGGIYWSPKTCAHEVHGGIFDMWGIYGKASGPLGFPITDELESNDNFDLHDKVSYFENGAIFWKESSPTHKLTIVINDDFYSMLKSAIKRMINVIY
jgi:hypothetical protein